MYWNKKNNVDCVFSSIITISFIVYCKDLSRVIETQYTVRERESERERERGIWAVREGRTLRKCAVFLNKFPMQLYIEEADEVDPNYNLYVDLSLYSLTLGFFFKFTGSGCTCICVGVYTVTNLCNFTLQFTVIIQ